MGHGMWQFGFAGKGALLLHLAAALALSQFVLVARVHPPLASPSRINEASGVNERAVGFASSQADLQAHVRTAHTSVRDPSRFYDPSLAMLAESLDAKSRYYAATALEECYALSHDGAVRFRNDFARRLNTTAAIPDKSHNWLREHAFSRSNRDCLAFDGSPISPSYIFGLIQSAARDGDPRAIARTLLFRDLADSKAGNFDVIAGLLSTGDPHVIRDVGLYLTRGESTLILNDSAEPVRASTLAVAWELVACDFGLDCGADSKLLNNLCAYQGQCGAFSYEDWLGRYSESREELAEILRLRMVLRRGLMFHDWTLLGLPARQPPATAR